MRVEELRCAGPGPVGLLPDCFAIECVIHGLPDPDVTEAGTTVLPVEKEEALKSCKRGRLQLSRPT